MCCKGETRHWGLNVTLVEFAYKNAVNRSTSESPFEVSRGYSHYTPIDLIPLPLDA